MNRIVQPELLDELPADDPRARWSRRDLRRVNAWMRNHVIMARALKSGMNGWTPRQIVEFGAGDGNLMLQVAQRLAPGWPNVSVTLLDRKRSVDLRTADSLSSLGWRAQVVEADVFDWLPTASGLDVVVANLLLHHFEDARLKKLFGEVARRARLFVAIEPRRALWPLFWCRWIWAIGCNSVTRHDAIVSVHAGFSNNELSALWPADGYWKLTECRTGSFSHLFVARRMD